MTRDELLALLRDIDGNALWKNEGRISKAIEWLEDEGNKELVDDRCNGSESKGVWWGWVLR